MAKWALIHLKWFVAAVAVVVKVVVSFFFCFPSFTRLFFQSFSGCCFHLLRNEGQLNYCNIEEYEWFDKNEITSFSINRKMLCSDTDDRLFRPFTVRALLLSFQLYGWWCNSSRWCSSCFDAHFPMNVRKTPVESAAQWIDDGDYFVMLEKKKWNVSGGTNCCSDSWWLFASIHI